MRGDLPTQLILASSSPRRRELLKTFNIPFEVIVSGVSEQVDTNISAVEMVKLLAKRKAVAVADKLDTGLVIGSDTTVALEGVILGKPIDEEDARRTLRMLRNIYHQVISGLAIVDISTRITEFQAVTTYVKMRNYTDHQIDEYVASGEPMDKAGSYAIQEQGSTLIETIQGCYSNVIGMPLCELAVLLQKFGVYPNLQGPACKLPSGAPCPRLVT